MEDSTNDFKNTVSTGLGTVANDTYNYINNLLSNPIVIIILVFVLILYIVLFMSLGDRTVIDQNRNVSNSNSRILTIILVAFFIVLIIINGLQYFFGIDIIAKLKNVFTGSPEVDITIDTSKVEAKKAPVPEILIKPQVFNIPGNEYNYPDAKALCSAYGARLATYSELEETYKKGGEWCNYGWSDGQMALFPTQQKTYNELQKIEGHENDCGRPGVNGGYIANPKIKFGVNCFGYKPRMNSTEEELMATEPIYPKTLKDIAMEQRVNYWKGKLSEILVSPFNHNTWSRL
jgi:succinate dehydrogenase hydrophobic anchor subunit